MSLREQVQEELIACSADQKRDTMRLRLLADDFALIPGFDHLRDGELENRVIQFLSSR